MNAELDRADYSSPPVFQVVVGGQRKRLIINDPHIAIYLDRDEQTLEQTLWLSLAIGYAKQWHQAGMRGVANLEIGSSILRLKTNDNKEVVAMMNNGGRE